MKIKKHFHNLLFITLTALVSIFPFGEDRSIVFSPVALKTVPLLSTTSTANLMLAVLAVGCSHVRKSSGRAAFGAVTMFGSFTLFSGAIQFYLASAKATGFSSALEISNPSGEELVIAPNTLNIYLSGLPTPMRLNAIRLPNLGCPAIEPAGAECAAGSVLAFSKSCIVDCRDGTEVIVIDYRLKRGVRLIGLTIAGYPWYGFRYLWSEPEFEGVLAHGYTVSAA